ncbi:magnesium transporter [Halomonas sp. YLGW01]|uniref:magnesium transporter n=1 Tax=Halomonas sp. YLGW01 TaxID=2773308 RepID=UPI001781963B|nr:magnesium transporter [Halomonas sp. YLGW01]
MTETTDTLEGRLSRIHEALVEHDYALIDEVLGDLEPAEIALLLESLPQTARTRLWERVPQDVDGDVLLQVHDEVRSTLIEDMDDHEIVAATSNMDTSDLAELFEDLPQQVAEDMLRSMDELQRERLKEALSFEEDSAGRLMRTDTVSVRADVTLETVQRFLRWKNQSIPDNTDALMVVDRNGIFVGVLPLARLVSQPAELAVADVLESDIDSVSVTMKSWDVATLFQTHDLVSAPVVDEGGLLLGRIVIDDIVDVIREGSDQALMNMAGLDEEEDLFAPVIPSAKRRAVWLGINLMTAFLAAWVIGRFEAALDQIVALAVLMPIVASMGGIAGSQTLTLAIRGLALGQISRTNSNWLMRKEIGISLINGVLWALVVAAIATLWFKDVRIGGIIAVALVINMLAAGIAGIAIPLGLKRLGIDPALSGSVVLTTVTDVIGFMAFLGLATVFLL